MCQCSPRPGGPPSPDERPVFDRCKVKNLLLWSARTLFAGGAYTGPVEVEARYLATGDAILFRPESDADGLTAPPGVTVSDPAPDALPPASDLVRHFLSDDARAILRELAARGPCQASDVQQALAAAGRVSRTNFWPIWKTLQVRQLVAEGPGGFRLGPPWLAALLEDPPPS